MSYTYNQELLVYIVDNCEKQGFALIGSDYQADVDRLIEFGAIELDPNGPDVAGNIRVAATDFGVKSAGAVAGRTPEPVVEQPAAPAMPAWAQPNGKLHVQTDDLALKAALEHVPEPKVQYRSAGETEDAVYQVSQEPAFVPLRGPVFVPQLQAISGGIEIVTGLSVPTKKQRTRATKPIDIYPFATMDVGTAFYVPVSAEFPLPAKDFGKMVSMANRRYSRERIVDGQTVMIENRFNRTKKDAAGNIIYDASGQKVVEEVVNMVPELEYDRKFSVYDAKKIPNQPHRTGAYVFRVM